MTIDSTLAPIVAEVTVPGSPTTAFVGFTAQMGEWWDPLLTPDAATFTGIEIDPDGEVAMRHGDERYVWGRVTTWDPSGHYAQDFWLGHGSQEPTHLDVRFTEDGRTTRVRLEHSGWAADSESVREKYAHWPDLLQRYAAHVG